MFRAIGSPATLVATTVDSGTHRRYCARGYAISGHATNSYVRTPPQKLGGSRAASWNLPGLADQDNDLSLQMSLAFQVRNHPRLRSFHPAAQAHGGGGDFSHGAAGGFGNFINSVCKKLRKIGDAFAPQEYDTLHFKRRGFVKVPRGRPVSEREWAELDADREVKFSPRIGATLIPTRGETYPTPARTAACFFSDQEMVEEATCISAGEGGAEWEGLLAEIRREAADAREKAVQARLQTVLQQQQQKKKEEEAQQVEPSNLFGALGAFFERKSWNQRQNLPTLETSSLPNVPTKNVM